MIKLTAEQPAFIEKQNPAIQERLVQGERPGELLCEDASFVGTLEGAKGAVVL